MKTWISQMKGRSAKSAKRRQERRRWEGEEVRRWEFKVSFSHLLTFSPSHLLLPWRSLAALALQFIHTGHGVSSKRHHTGDEQDHDDDQQQTDPAAGVVTPIATVRP